MIDLTNREANCKNFWNQTSRFNKPFKSKKAFDEVSSTTRNRSTTRVSDTSCEVKWRSHGIRRVRDIRCSNASNASNRRRQAKDLKPHNWISFIENRNCLIGWKLWPQFFLLLPVNLLKVKLIKVVLINVMLIEVVLNAGWCLMQGGASWRVVIVFVMLKISGGAENLMGKTTVQ